MVGSSRRSGAIQTCAGATSRRCSSSAADVSFDLTILDVNDPVCVRGQISGSWVTPTIVLPAEWRRSKQRL